MAETTKTRSNARALATLVGALMISAAILASALVQVRMSPEQVCVRTLMAMSAEADRLQTTLHCVR